MPAVRKHRSVVTSTVASMRAGLVVLGAFGAAQCRALEPATDTGASPLQLELSARSFPRLDRGDGLGRQSQLELAMLSPGRSAAGFGVRVTNFEAPRLPGPYAVAPAAVDLGLRLRYAPGDAMRVDVSAWRRLSPSVSDLMGYPQPQDTSGAYGARIEVGAAAPRATNFRQDRFFLGFQLEGNARIGIKRSGGHPMVYYRNQF